MTDTPTLGALLRDLRGRAGLEGQAAAAALGVTRSTYYNWEGGKRLPGRAACAAIAAAYDVDPDLLHCLCGRVPPDLAEALTDYPTVQHVRRCLNGKDDR